MTDTRVVVVTKREREVLVLQVPTYKLIVEQKGPRGPKGDPGVDGILSVPAATAANAVVQRALDGTFLTAPLTLDQIAPAYSINSFGLTGASIVEVGTTIAAPAFTASYSATPTSAILTDDQGSASRDVSSTPTAFSATASYTKGTPASVTWTLSAHSASSPTKARSTSASWLQRIHYGAGAPGLRSAAAILALSSNPLAGGRTGSFPFATGNTAANQKAYFAIPSGFGTPVFKNQGLPFAMALVAAAVAVTSNGVVQSYDLYESDNVGLGSFTLDVS